MESISQENIRSSNHSSPLCSRAMAALLIGRSERSLQRWMQQGELVAQGFDRSGRIQLDLDKVLSLAGAVSPCAAEMIETIVLADSGDPVALNDLGMMLLFDQRLKPRPSSAAALFQAAAAKHFPDAMHWLFYCFLNGIGVAKDNATALRWLSQAASFGHQIAKAQLSIYESYDANISVAVHSA